MDDDEKWLANSLVDEATSTGDRLLCIQSLEALLLVEAVPYFVIVVKNDKSPYEIRERAAKAISAIGSSYVQEELDELRLSASPSLTHLLDLAQGKTAA